MKKAAVLVTALALFMAGSMVNPAMADEYQKTIDIFKKFHQSAVYFDNSYGFAVFPTIGKGGVGVGGAHGTGQVYRDGEVTGGVTMTQLSIGLQLGGQAYKEIIFFQDKRAYDQFTSGSFEFGAEASAVAIKEGARAGVGTAGSSASTTRSGSKANYKKGGIAVFTHAIGGLMYEAAVGGQKFKFQPN
jgi:lipid-binding SYLF domain-containing protein